MLQMQHRMNSRVHEDWINQGFEWYRAAWIECGELMDHVGYKWWKKQTLTWSRSGLRSSTSGISVCQHCLSPTRISKRWRGKSPLSFGATEGLASDGSPTQRITRPLRRWRSTLFKLKDFP